MTLSGRSGRVEQTRTTRPSNADIMIEEISNLHAIHKRGTTPNISRAATAKVRVSDVRAPYTGMSSPVQCTVRTRATRTRVYSRAGDHNGTAEASGPATAATRKNKVFDQNGQRQSQSACRGACRDAECTSGPVWYELAPVLCSHGINPVVFGPVQCARYTGIPAMYRQHVRGLAASTHRSPINHAATDCE